MRNLHAVIKTEFGKENVAILRKLEYLEKKISDFSNHVRLNLKCLSQNITQTSLKLKGNIKTPGGKTFTNS